MPCWDSDRRGQTLVEELRGREALITSILATVPDAMVVIDERGAIQSFSQAAERQFGFAADEVIGRNVSMLMPANYAREHNLPTWTIIGRPASAKSFAPAESWWASARTDTFPMDLAVGEVTLPGQRLFTGSSSAI